MAVTRRFLIPVFGAAFAAAAIVAASFGLIAALPQPTKGDRVAVGVLRYLEHTRGRGGLISIGGHVLLARCTPLSPRRKRITLSDGARFVLRGSHIEKWSTATSRRATRRPDSGVARAAIADLAGSYALYADELSRPLAHGKAVVEAMPGRSPKYRVVLARRPYVDLVVDGATLRPLSARFRSARVSAQASLLPPARKSGKRLC
jgi:hypothetical protein